MLVAPPMSRDAADRRNRILGMLPATAKEIELALGYTVGGSFTQINNLLRMGLIERSNNVYYRTTTKKPKFPFNIMKKG